MLIRWTALSLSLSLSLFDTTAEGSQRKKPKLSRNAAEEARKRHQIMTIDVEGHGSVRVLRPVLHSDSLFVHYNSESLANMIKFIRDSGFDHGLSWHQDKSLP